MPPTLEDIARLSGVSRSTVSRIINGDARVRDETRTRVEVVIASLNYHPNLAARGLAEGRTSILGLVIPIGVAAIFSDPYFPLVIQGVSAACNSLGYAVMLWLPEPDYESRMIGQILNNSLIAGIIVTSMRVDDPLIDLLAASGRAFLTIGRHPTNDKVSYVDVDNRRGAYQGVAYMLRTGHRRIAVINGPTSAIASWDRSQGYQDALRERGLPVPAELTAEGDFTDAGGYLAMKGLLTHCPDAVFVASDAMAFGAMRAIQEAGLRIPGDLAVVGFDDIPPAATSKPPLTTVRQPIQRLGALAAETLIEMISHPDGQPHRVVLPTELVIRASC